MERGENGLSPQDAAYEQYIANYWQSVADVSSAANQRVNELVNLSPAMTTTALNAELGAHANAISEAVSKSAQSFYGTASQEDADAFTMATVLFDREDYDAAYEMIDSKASSEHAREAMRYAMDSFTNAKLTERLSAITNDASEDDVNRIKSARTMVYNFGASETVISALLTRIDMSIKSGVTTNPGDQSRAQTSQPKGAGTAKKRGRKSSQKRDSQAKEPETGLDIFDPAGPTAEEMHSPDYRKGNQIPLHEEDGSKIIIDGDEIYRKRPDGTKEGIAMLDEDEPTPTLPVQGDKFRFRIGDDPFESQTIVNDPYEGVATNHTDRGHRGAKAPVTGLEATKVSRHERLAKVAKGVGRAATWPYRNVTDKNRPLKVGARWAQLGVAALATLEIVGLAGGFGQTPQDRPAITHNQEQGTNQHPGAEGDKKEKVSPSDISNLKGVLGKDGDGHKTYKLDVPEKIKKALEAN